MHSRKRIGIRPSEMLSAAVVTKVAIDLLGERVVGRGVSVETLVEAITLDVESLGDVAKNITINGDGVESTSLKLASQSSAVAGLVCEVGELAEELVHSSAVGHVLRGGDVEDLGTGGNDERAVLISNSLELLRVEIVDLRSGSSRQDPRVTSGNAIAVVDIARISAEEDAGDVLVVSGVDGVLALEPALDVAERGEDALVVSVEGLTLKTAVQSTQNGSNVHVFLILGGGVITVILGGSDVVEASVVEAIEVDRDGIGLRDVEIGSIEILQLLCKLRTLEESLTLDHAHEEMTAVDLLPRLKGQISPVVGDVLKIVLDALLDGEIREVHLGEDVIGLAIGDQLVSVVDEHAGAESRTIVLVATPRTIEDATIDIGLGLTTNIEARVARLAVCLENPSQVTLVQTESRVLIREAQDSHRGLHRQGTISVQKEGEW